MGQIGAIQDRSEPFFSDLAISEQIQANTTRDGGVASR